MSKAAERSRLEAELINAVLAFGAAHAKEFELEKDLFKREAAAGNTLAKAVLDLLNEGVGLSLVAKRIEWTDRHQRESEIDLSTIRDGYRITRGAHPGGKRYWWLVEHVTPAIVPLQAEGQTTIEDAHLLRVYGALQEALDLVEGFVKARRLM